MYIHLSPHLAGEQIYIFHTDNKYTKQKENEINRKSFPYKGLHLAHTCAH